MPLQSKRAAVSSVEVLMIVCTFQLEETEKVIQRFRVDRAKLQFTEIMSVLLVVQTCTLANDALILHEMKNEILGE